MRETQFINQNKEKWQEFEHILEGEQHDPEKLNDLFIQVTDDLSYSRTFYPNRSVRVYLNGLAQRVFLSVYRARRSPLGHLLSFWTDELPKLIYESRKAFRLSFWIFAFSFIVGVVSSAMDPEFAGIILGEDYIQMTQANIESGDPMAVYKQRGAFSMSLGITFNNLFVAFLTFVMGAFFALGAIIIIIRNGIMVGVFQYFFIERDLFWDSFLTIWIHGTLEISAIIIAGAAGITMGRGLLFPGTYTRMQAFQQSARRGLKIMLGITPIFIMAGFIEGYLTRHTQTPDLIRGLFILVCLAFILLYFVWYPRFRAKISTHEKASEETVAPDHYQAIDFERIKSSGEVFADIFIFFRKHAGKVAGICLLSTSIYTGTVFLTWQGLPEELFSFPSHLFGTLSVINQFFVHPMMPWLLPINFIVFGLLTVLINRLIIRERTTEGPDSFRHWLVAGLKVSLGLAPLQFILWIDNWYMVFLIPFLFPVAFLYNFIMMEEDLLPWPAVKRTAFLLRDNFGRLLALFLVLALLGLLFFSLLDTMLLWTFLDLISWVVQLEESIMNDLSVVILTFTTIFFLHMIVGMLLTGMGLIYFSLLEIQEAGSIKKKVAILGKQHQIQGLDRES